MTNTRNKLSEVEFFLNHMIGSQHDQDKADAFGYYFSAFLSAFRSVTLIMQKEFSGNEFESWYKNIQTFMKNHGKMKLLETLRDIVLHRWNCVLDKQETLTVYVTAGVISVQATVVTPIVRIDGELLPSNHNDKQRASPNLKKQKEPAGTSDIETTILWTIDKEGFDDESKKDIMKIPDIDEILKIDVVTICKEGMSTLSDIVSECERMFAMA